MSLRTEVAKNNIIFTAGNIAAAVLSFIFSIVVARLLGPEQFGLFSFSLVVMGLFTVFIDLGISSTLIKFMSGYLEKGENSRAGSLIKFLFKFRFGTALLVGFVMATFSSEIAIFLFNKPEGQLFVVFSAGLLISNALMDFVNTVLLGFKNFKQMIFIRLCERSIKIFFSVMLVISGFLALGAVAGVIAAFLVASATGFVFIRKHKDVIGSKGPVFEKRLLLSFGFWVFAGTFVSSLFMMTDALLVSMLRPLQDIGFYSIGMSWMNLIIYVVPISSIVMYPYFAGLGNLKLRTLQDSMKYGLMAAMPVGFLMSAFSPRIIEIFYGAGFAPAASALSMLGLVGITLVISPLLMGYFYGSGKPKAHTCVLMAVLAVNVLLVYYMTSIYGIWGAAAGMLASRIIEISALVLLIRVSEGGGIRLENILKPAIASLVIYIIAAWLTVPGLVELVVYGVALVILYALIMLATGGIEREELRGIINGIRLRIWMMS